MSEKFKAVTPTQLKILQRIKPSDPLLIDEGWMRYPGGFYFQSGGKANRNSVNALIRHGYLVVVKSVYRNKPKQLVLTDAGKELVAQSAATPPARAQEE